MSALERWLDVRARREARRVLLEDALIGGRMAAYLWYRLRWVGLTLVVLMAVNLLELWFFFAVFMQRGVLVAVVARNVLQLINSFFFGALDDLRHRVPLLLAEGDHERLRDEIDAWFTLSLLVAIGASLTGGAYILWDIHYGLGVFSVFHLYWIACLVRLACELPVRALHSAVFALRRVYRPFFSFALIDGVGLLLVLLVYRWIHLWSFAAALIVAAPMAAAVALFFVVRAYREARLPAPRVRLRAVVRLFRSAQRLRDALEGGAAYTLMRLGAFLVLIVAFFEKDLPRGTLPLAVVLHAVGPLINAGAGWAQLFYFDLKRLGEPTLIRLRMALKMRLSRASLLIGLLLWGLAISLLIVAYGARLQVSLFATVLLFSLRARLAVEQVDLFAARRYGRLLLASAPVVLAAWALSRFALPTQQNALWVVDALVLLALVTAMLATRGVEPRRMLRAVESFHSWRREVATHQGPVVVVAARLAPKSPSASRVALSLAPVLGQRIGLVDRRRLVWCDSARPEGRDLIMALGGFALELEISGPHADGHQALLAAAHNGFFGAALKTSPENSLPTGRGALEQRLTQVFSFDHVQPWDLRQRPPKVLRALDHAQRRAVLGAAVAFATGLRSRRQKPPMDVACLAPEGTIEVIYLLDREGSEAARAAFKGELRRFNRGHWAQPWGSS
ncbi:MAG: hypothetical protein JRH20_02940 [Deltaproteobacteria bacterium]|nr:hypothetical protein [Deltaproteobacteria bacterium]